MRPSSVIPTHVFPVKRKLVQSAPRPSQSLFPDLEEDAGPVDDNVEEDDISDDSYRDGENGQIDDLAPPFLCFVERTDPSSAPQVDNERSEKEKEPGSAENPLVLPVQDI